MKEQTQPRATRPFEQALAPMVLLPDAERRTVTVVGAGVVGLSAALWLQYAGHVVTLVDRVPPAPGVPYEHASSFGNACTMAYGACLPVATPGILAQVPKMLLDREGPLSIFWRDLPGLAPWLWSFLRASTTTEVSRISAVLGTLLRHAEAGHAPLIQEACVEGLVRQTGCLYLFRNEKQFQSAQGDIAIREREGVRMQILSAAEVREREPNLAPLYHKGLVFSDAYSLDDPHRYVLGLARAFHERGGRMVKGDVTAVTSGTDGVSVRAGEHTLTAEHVVIAGGAWSKRLAQQVGDKIRLDTERGYHVMFPDSAHLVSAPTCYPDSGFYMTPLTEGLRAAGTVELGGLDLPARTVRTDIIEKRARQFLPQLGRAERTWLGFRPSMPDSLPVVGRSPKDERVIYAFGHGHVGLTLAGITGRLVSDLVSRRPTPFDISALRPDRY